MVYPMNEERLSKKNMAKSKGNVERDHSCYARSGETDLTAEHQALRNVESDHSYYINKSSTELTVENQQLVAQLEKSRRQNILYKEYVA